MSPTPPAPDPAALDILTSLRQIVQQFDVLSRHFASTASITLPQLMCLKAVIVEEGLTAREIAARIFVGSSTLVGILDRLEDKGLVERARDRVDRRRVLVVPTERGRSLVASLPFPLGARFEERFADLSPRSRKDLATALRRVVSLMAP